MAYKKIFAGILVLALVFGMALVACSDGGSDSGLNGTWVASNGDKIVFSSDNFTLSDSKGELAKGTYTTSGNSITLIVKYINGGHPSWYNTIK